MQEALELVVRDPLRKSGISPAALYRSVEAREPTLLLEECDAIFGGGSSEALRGLLDSGNRRGGSYTVNVPKGSSEWEAKQFSTFCPKCLGGIDSGKFPDTLLDRSVVLRLVGHTSDRGRPQQAKDSEPRPHRHQAEHPACMVEKHRSRDLVRSLSSGMRHLFVEFSEWPPLSWAC